MLRDDGAIDRRAPRNVLGEPNWEVTMTNQKFIIQPHFRLQVWVADEKGYFRDEGLDDVFQETVKTTEGKSHDQNGAKSGSPIRHSSKAARPT